MADGSNNHYSSSDKEDSNSQDDTKQQTPNIFRNDGSFMEMFKKMQEDQKKKEEPTPEEGKSATEEQQKKSTLSFVGKRRGGRILATGMVKKQRKEPEGPKDSAAESGKTDAWSQYMNEVRKYKEQSCEEEGKGGHWSNDSTLLGAISHLYSFSL